MNKRQTAKITAAVLKYGARFVFTIVQDVGTQVTCKSCKYSFIFYTDATLDWHKCNPFSKLIDTNDVAALKMISLVQNYGVSGKALKEMMEGETPFLDLLESQAKKK